MVLFLAVQQRIYGELEPPVYRLITYVILRLLPRRSSSIEGKRHVQAVPVRLIKASNDEHKKHDDQYFATNTINHLKTLAGSFGTEAVFF